MYKEEVESYSENTDEPVRKSFNILVKLALHVMNLLPIPVQCAIDVRRSDLTRLHHSIDLLERGTSRIETKSIVSQYRWTQEIDLTIQGSVV